MRVYIKFIINTYLRSIIFVTLTMLSLAIIINTLAEYEFFRDIKVSTFLPIYLATINSPTLIFEMFPFIFLISTQLFFINLLSNNEIEVFKYSGLKNSSILRILSILSFFLGMFIIIIFYYFSSNLKNLYLETKSKYTTDGKYLAVITNNGLWIKDVIDGKTSIVSASKFDENLLIDTIITEFNSNYDVIRNIRSKKVNIENFDWQIYDAEVFENQQKTRNELLKKKSNYNYARIKSLFSNLSSLPLNELFILKRNYELLNYSTTEVNVQINKIISYPFYLTVMTILSAIIMFNTKRFKSSTLKIAFGLFLSVIIYYTFNFFNVMGNTEKLSIVISVWLPILILIFINSIMVYKINEK